MLFVLRPSTLPRIRYPSFTLVRLISSLAHRNMSNSAPHSSASSSAGSVSGFPEEDLREGGRDNPGYFAARLGQPLREGRYCIIRKLGWGQYSSVWLAKDRG